jgi:hypothetical protein
MTTRKRSASAVTGSLLRKSKDVPPAEWAKMFKEIEETEKSIHQVASDNRVSYSTLHRKNAEAQNIAGEVRRRSPFRNLSCEPVLFPQVPAPEVAPSQVLNLGRPLKVGKTIENSLKTWIIHRDGNRRTKQGIMHHARELCGRLTWIHL